MKAPTHYSRLNGFGAIIFLGCVFAAAYFGAIDAPSYIHAQILLLALFGALLAGKDSDESWFSYLFWGIITAAVTIGLVATISRWIAFLST